MPRIFISYRREDSEHITGRIHDRLGPHFGSDNVFIDIDTIPFGVDFRKHLDQAVSQCDVLLVVIGEKWLEVRHRDGPRQGTRRLDDTSDFVRIEIQSALARGIPVIPVLVGRAGMPTEQDLPDGLKDLAYRNAVEVRSGRDYNDQVERLIRGVNHLLRQREKEEARRAAVGAEERGQQQENAGTLAKRLESLPQPVKKPSTRRALWWLVPVVLTLLVVLAVGVAAVMLNKARRQDTNLDTPQMNKPVDSPSYPNRPPMLDCTGQDGVSPVEVRKAQEAWAKYLKREVEETVEIANGVKMTFVLIPPGNFRMGSPEIEDGRDKDELLHEVTLSEPFYLGKHPVTQEQYQTLIGKNPSEFKGALFPVETVSWEDARDFAETLTKKRADRQLYRLPTEAEWEYSCRGGRGSSKAFGIGDGRTLSSREANFHGSYPYGDAEKRAYLNSTCNVGSYCANAFGLYDMHGNVWQWCADRYGPYFAREVTNPAGPPEGSFRVLRGGSWSNHGVSCRAAHRFRFDPSSRNYGLGFRLARSVPSEVK